MKRKINIIGLTLFFTLALFSFVFSEESMTITTYYPSPYGSYNELRTYSNTYLATDSGNVGIGTTNPGAPLEIVSTGYSSSQVIVKYDSARFMNIGHSWLKMNAGNYGNDLEFQTDAVGTGGGHRILFEPAGSTAMTILTNGNVGIGTVSPTQKLDVAGSIQASGAVTSGGTPLRRAWTSLISCGVTTCPPGWTLYSQQTYDNAVGCFTAKSYSCYQDY